MPCQTVGTPPLMVTPSDAIRSARSCGSHARARVDVPRAGERGGVGDAPGVGVEHRHDRHHRIGLADVHRVRQAHRQRVQDRGTVRVDDALRPARRAARVAHGRGAALVEVGELEARVSGCDQLLVVERALALSLGVRHQHLALHALELRHHSGQRGVEEDDPVLGVPDDVAQVVLEEADVEGVEHGSHARHGQVELEVASEFQPKVATRSPRSHPHALQRAGEAPGALGHLPVRGTLDAVPRTAHDLALPGTPFRPARPRGERAAGNPSSSRPWAQPSSPRSRA